MRYLARLALTGAILAIVFRVVPFTKVAAAVSGASLALFLGGVFFQLVVRYLAALRTKILTDEQGLALSAARIFEINCSSTFYGLILPGDLVAGAVRWYKLAGPDGSRAAVLAVVMLDRIVDTVALILLGLLFFSLDAGPRAAGTVAAVAAGATLVGLSAAYAAIYHERSSRLVKLALARLPLPQVLRHKLERLRAEAHKFRTLSARSLGRFAGLALARHLAGLVSLYLLALSIGLSLSFVQVGGIRSFVQIVTLLPVTISGLGLREVSVVALSQHYGAGAVEALAWSVLIFAATLAIALVGGAVEMRDSWFRRHRAPAEAR